MRGPPLVAALGVVAALLPGRALSQPTPPPGVAFAAGFQPGSRQLFALDLSGTPVGESPSSIKLLKGNLEVVIQGGVRMLKASSASEFLVTLAQVLPADFTLEFDLIPKSCCPPPDLTFEGTPTINQGPGSAHLLWQADGYLGVIGGAQDNYETPMPDDLRATLRGVRTQVEVSFAGPTVKLYTNGRRLYTLDRQFARGQVLRVFLGGESDANPVYLAGLRIATGGPQRTIVQTTPQPGPRSAAPFNPPGAAPAPSIPPVSPAPAPIATRPGAASGPVTTLGSGARNLARCTPGAPTAAPPQQFTPFGLRVGGAPLQWISEPNTAYLVERAPAASGATVVWTRLASSCDATPSLVAGSWVSEDLNTYPTLGLVDVYPGVQLGSGYQYRLTRIELDGSSGSSIVYWEAPTGSFQAAPSAAVNGHTVTITTAVSYCQPHAQQCDPWMLEFAVTSSTAGFGYSTQQHWVDNSNPGISGSAPGTFAFAVTGVPSGTHTFAVTALYQPDHRVSAGAVTVVVP